MFNFIMSLLRKKERLPEPARFPERGRVGEWMEEKVRYFEQEYPDRLHYLFNPTYGDYLPLAIAVGVSEKHFHEEHLAHYREIKSRYPEAAANKDYNCWVSYFPGGDPEDYIR